MAELRWAMLLLGVVFVVGLALWEWRRNRPVRSDMQKSPESASRFETPTRVEPSIDDFADGTRADLRMNDTLDVPTIHPTERYSDASSLVDLEVVPEVAVDMPSAPRRAPEPALIKWPPQQSERVLGLRVVVASGQPLQGRALRIALDAAGLVHGPQQIYHLATEDGTVLASAANLLRPGSFDPAQMDGQEFRGLNLFSVLPGPMPAAKMLEDLLLLARGIAGRLGAVVQDDQGQALDAERLRALRQSLTP
jgi:FtsZ-interacting cell division protein ZipA